MGAVPRGVVLGHGKEKRGVREMMGEIGGEEESADKSLAIGRVSSQEGSLCVYCE